MRAKISEFRSFPLVLLVVPLLMLPPGCGSEHRQQEYLPAPQPGVTDLIFHFPTAQLRFQSDGIDIGEPQARPLLISGWSWDELSDRRSFVWAMGDSSSLRLYLHEPCDLELRLVGWTWSQLQPQQVRVAVNGTQVGTLDIAAEQWQTYRLQVPAAALVAGDNLVELSYQTAELEYVILPSSGDIRPLAVAWDRVEIDGPHNFGEPSIDTEAARPALFLPYAARVDYYLDMQPGSRFLVEELTTWGKRQASPGALLVDLESIDGSLRQQAELQPSQDGASVPFDLPRPMPVRLSLRARPGVEDGRGRAGLRLTAPIVKAPVLPEEPPPSETRTAASRTRPNIIIYLIDALRADHLGCYGYDRPTSPHIDTFARDAVLCARTLAQSSWTRPAVTSLLSGAFPQTHGVNGGRTALPHDLTTLPQLLQDAGYETAAVVTNGVVSQQFGFDRGFDSFRYLPELHETDEVHQQSDRVNEVALAWLQQRSGGPEAEQPFLLYLHTCDPHAPYTPREPFAGQLAGAVPDPQIGLLYRIDALVKTPEIPPELPAQLAQLYDGEIAGNDASFGELLERLRELDLYDSSIIILVSDHGEELSDHGRWQHGLSLYQDQLHVPLLIKLPGQEAAGLRLEPTTTQADLLPTLLDYLGAPIPAQLDGTSLLAAIRGQAVIPVRPAYATLTRDPEWRELSAVVVGDLKLISYQRYDKPRGAIELYDVSRDPAERHDLSLEQPLQAGYLLSLLQKARDPKRAQAADADIAPEMEENLRSLGYLE